MRYVALFLLGLLAGCAGPAQVPAAVRWPAPRLDPAARGQPIATAGPRYDYRPGPMATAMALPTPTDAPPTATSRTFSRVALDLRPGDMATAMAMATPTASSTPTASATPTPSPTPTLTPVPPTHTPTTTPTLSPVEAIEATWTVEAATTTTPAPLLARPRGIRRSFNAADMLAPGSLPRTLAGVHFAGPTVTAPELLGAAADVTGWAMEVAYASDDQFEALRMRELIALSQRGFRVILRIDYAHGQHIPPLYDPEALARYVDAFRRYYSGTDRWVKYFVVGNEGNIDAQGIDPDRLTECRAGPDSCEPEAYALVYRAVRRALRTETDAYVLVGATSPGPADHAARWMDGGEYLNAVLNFLHPSEVDGIALHAYAPGTGADPAPPEYLAAAVRHFAGDLTRQIDAARDAGFVSTPLFVTEMNQQLRPDPQFVREAYQWIDAHNRRSRQDIVAACWFVYHDETGDWAEVALEHAPAVLEAFKEAGAYPPGR